MAALRDAAPNNLPADLTSFVGRRRELAEVARLLAGCRLLTLTGEGGCGKSRLALAAGRAVLNRFVDGAWVVELAALSDATLVPQAIAKALDVPEQPHVPMAGTLGRALRSKVMVLILDNCEHLLVACAQLADALLRECPGLRILVTSREPLGVPGETTWRVPSLSMPDPQQLPPHDQLVEFEAVRLFADRARSMRPEFLITANNARAVAQTCHQLDGMPLAIELAAARIRTLTVEQIAARLDDRFRLLTGGGPTVLPRHQTLRATMDWSYDLLSEPERIVLRRLSVFARGWTLEAAETVCSGAGVETADVLDLLARLVDKSLVVMEPRGGEARYHLLETVRQYGRDRLRDSGELRAVFRRHRDWYRDLSEQAEPELRGPGQQYWLERLEVEHDNARAALQWSLGNGEARAALQMAIFLRSFWHRKGHLVEGRRWLEEGLRQDTPPPAVRIRALNALGHFAFFQADFASVRAALTESLVLARQTDDRQGLVDALSSMGGAAVFRGEFAEARSLLGESLAVSRQLGDQRGIATSVGHLGLVAADCGDYRAARSLYRDALAIFRALGDTTVCATLLHNLGHVMSAQGEHAAARALFQESLGLARGLGLKHSIAHYSANLAVVEVHEGEFVRARSLLEESLLAFRDLGDKRGICRALEGFGILASAQGQAARAATVLGAADSLRGAITAPLPVSDRAHYQYDRYVATACAALGEEAFAVAWAEGAAMPADGAIEYALTAGPARQRIAGAPHGGLATNGRDAHAGRLTAREREVAALVARGLTNRAIAARLVIAERTAEGHVQNILNKLGISSRAQIAAWAVAQGLNTGLRGHSSSDQRS